MDTRSHYVKDLQKTGVLKVEFVRSEDNTSDVQTKNVSGDIHEKHLGTYTAEKGYLKEGDNNGNTTKQEGCRTGV